MGSCLSSNQNSYWQTDDIVLQIKNSNVDEIKKFLDKCPNAIYANFFYITDEINGKVVNKYTLIDYVIQFEASVQCLDLLLSRGARPNNYIYTLNFNNDFTHYNFISMKYKRLSIQYFFLFLLYANENVQMKRKSYELVIGTKILYCCLKKNISWLLL